MKDKIKLEAEIDFTTTPNETRVKPIDGDPWDDFGYWLEVTGFMAYQAVLIPLIYLLGGTPNDHQNVLHYRNITNVISNIKRQIEEATPSKDLDK